VLQDLILVSAASRHLSYSGIVVCLLARKVIIPVDLNNVKRVQTQAAQYALLQISVLNVRIQVYISWKVQLARLLVQLGTPLTQIKITT